MDRIPTSFLELGVVNMVIQPFVISLRESFITFSKQRLASSDRAVKVEIWVWNRARHSEFEGGELQRGQMNTKNVEVSGGCKRKNERSARKNDNRLLSASQKRQKEVIPVHSCVPKKPKTNEQNSKQGRFLEKTGRK